MGSSFFPSVCFVFGKVNAGGTALPLLARGPLEDLHCGLRAFSAVNEMAWACSRVYLFLSSP